MADDTGIVPAQPYALLDDGDEVESSQVALETTSDLDQGILSKLINTPQPQEPAIIMPVPPSISVPNSSTSIWATPPPHTLGQQMAIRALRDAIALQLARRGYVGLRSHALWLVAELAGDYLKALGGQLAREGAVAAPGTPATQVVRRIQRHSNLHNLAEWRQVQLSFARVVEPAGATALGRSNDSRQQDKAPAPVAPLYSAMKGAWNYAMTANGRQAYENEGQTDYPSARDAPVPAGASGKDLSESLRLSKKQRSHADAWLQANASAVNTAPVLVPGMYIGDGASVRMQPSGVDHLMPAAPKPRGRKGKNAMA